MRIIKSNIITVVFIHEFLNVRIYKKAQALKSTNKYRVICITRILFKKKENLDEVFDEIYYYSPSFQWNKQLDLSFNKRWNKKYKIGFNNIIRLLKKIKPDIVHVFTDPYDLTHYLLQKTRYKIVLDGNDFNGISVGLENMNSDDRAIEKFCLENVSGICRKGPEFEIDYYRQKKYQITCPELQWLDYCGDENFITKKMENKNANNIVYIGAITDMPNSYNNYLSIGRQFALNKIHLHIYPSHSSLKFLDCEEYISLDKSEKYFHFYKSFPFDRLIKEISQYDWGFWVHPICGINKPGSTEEKFKVAIGNKFFAYLEAGLPIIVSDHLTFGKELVEKYKIGFAIKDEEIGQIMKKIEQYDYDELLRNINIARDKLSINNHVNRLEVFYAEVLDDSNLLVDKK